MAHPSGQSVFLSYAETVGDMNKIHNINMIENIFVQICKFLFFGRWRSLVPNQFFLFYGQPVGNMNKPHNFNTIEDIFVQFCKFLFVW